MKHLGGEREKGREGLKGERRERERERMNLSGKCWFILHMATTARAKPKTGASSFMHVRHLGGKGPGIWAIFYCLSQAILKELHWKWSRWGSNLALI